MIFNVEDEINYDEYKDANIGKMVSETTNHSSSYTSQLSNLLNIPNQHQSDLVNEDR